MAEKVFGDKYALFWKQGLFMALGFGILLTTMRANMEFFYRRTYFWILLAAALLLLMVFSPLGNKAGGASRWLRLGPVSVQPQIGRAHV